MQHKCVSNKVSYLSRFYDSSNAFYCCKRSDIVDFQNDSVDGFAAAAIDQVIDNCIAVCQASNGVTLLSPATGVAPGLHSSTKFLNHVYDKAL